MNLSFFASRFLRVFGLLLLSPPLAVLLALSTTLLGFALMIPAVVSPNGECEYVIYLKDCLKRLET